MKCPKFLRKIFGKYDECNERCKHFKSREGINPICIDKNGYAKGLHSDPKQRKKCDNFEVRPEFKRINRFRKWVGRNKEILALVTSLIITVLTVWIGLL